jgi:thiamine transport system substrate-binding protein
MSTRFFLLVAALAAASGVAQAASVPEREKEADLVIYTYDSFVAEWGPGPKVIPAFEARHGVRVEIVSAGDAGQVLSRAILEKDSPRADVLIGLDNNMLARALEAGVLQPYRPAAADRLPREAAFDPSFHLTPYDYGYFSFVVDTQKLSDPPRSLEDLTDPRFRRKILLEDPRTSSPGLGFLLWTIAAYGDRWLDYWQRLSPNILTIAEGWDAAYGMFTAGEAPLVLSYTTSPAYHAEYEKTTRYQAALFPEGHYAQVEGLGITRGARHLELARRFVDFALSDEFQREIPLTNWMYPVIPATRLPDSYRHAPQPPRFLALDAAAIAANQERWLTAWARQMSR